MNMLAPGSKIRSPHEAHQQCLGSNTQIKQKLAKPKQLTEKQFCSALLETPYSL